MSTLPTPFGAFRAKSDQSISVAGTERKCLKLKNKGTAVNLGLDKCRRALVIKKDYEGNKPSIYYSFSLSLFVKSGTGTVALYRDGVLVSSETISTLGQVFIADDYFISQPVPRGTTLSLCFQSSSATPLVLTVQDGIVALTT